MFYRKVRKNIGNGKHYEGKIRYAAHASYFLTAGVIC
jgi:hypothetical protein